MKHAAKALGVLIAILFNSLAHVAAAPTPTKALARYAPLHPANNAPVTFRLQANNSVGIKQVRFFIYEYDWSALELAEKRASGKWGEVQTWSWSSPYPVSVSVTNKWTSGFPAHSFVSFIFEVTDKNNVITNEYWGFAAGDWNFGTTPIPIWIRPPEGGARPELISDSSPVTNYIHAMFIAQRNVTGATTGDEYPSARAMLPDLEALIFDGCHQTAAIAMGKRFWAFHYSPEQGYIPEYGAGAMDLAASHWAITNMNATVGVIVHRRDFRDWRLGHFLGTEIAPEKFGTVLHEMGHAIFDLSDEYDSGSHKTSTTPYHNNYSSSSVCVDYSWDNYHLPVDCELIADGAWVVPEEEADHCAMRTSAWPPSSVGPRPRYAWSCLKRVQWYYEALKP